MEINHRKVDGEYLSDLEMMQLTTRIIALLHDLPTRVRYFQMRFEPLWLGIAKDMRGVQAVISFGGHNLVIAQDDENYSVSVSHNGAWDPRYDQRPRDGKVKYFARVLKTIALAELPQAAPRDHVWIGLKGLLEEPILQEVEKLPEFAI